MLNFKSVEIISAALVLFGIIDVFGSVPIFLNLKSQNKEINPVLAVLYSFIILVSFMFVGQLILNLFKVENSSFAVAGALVLLILSIEMIFGVEIFKNDSPGNNKSSTLFPVVFPLIAGPGTFTTILSMRAQYSALNIILAVSLNLIVVFFVLKYLNVVMKVMGAGGIYIMRKVFGVILMAVSVQMLTLNMNALISSFH